MRRFQQCIEIVNYSNTSKYLEVFKKHEGRGVLVRNKIIEISLGHQINKKKNQMLAKRVKLQVMNTNVLDGSCTDAVRNFALNM